MYLLLYIIQIQQIIIIQMFKKIETQVHQRDISITIKAPYFFPNHNHKIKQQIKNKRSRTIDYHELVASSNNSNPQTIAFNNDNLRLLKATEIIFPKTEQTSFNKKFPFHQKIKSAVETRRNINYIKKQRAQKQLRLLEETTSKLQNNFVSNPKLNKLKKQKKQNYVRKRTINQHKRHSVSDVYTTDVYTISGWSINNLGDTKLI